MIYPIVSALYRSRYTLESFGLLPRQPIGRVAISILLRDRSFQRNEPIFLLPALLWYEACGTDARSRNHIGKDTTMMLMTYTLPMAAMLIGLATYWMVTKLW